MDGPTDIDALADALREDGVVIDRVMGSGDASGAHDRIAQLVRETPFPLYVALVEEPDGVSGDATSATDSLATLLTRRLGDGMYVLQTTEGAQRVYSFGLGADPAQLSLSAYSNQDALDAAMAEVGDFRIGTEDYVYTPPIAKAEAVAMTAEDIMELGRGPSLPDAVYPSTLSDADAERLAEQALEVQARARWSPHTPDYVEVRTASRGLSALVGGLLALVVALLLGQSLRGWPRTRKGIPDQALAKLGPPDLETERARANELLDTLVKALEGTQWETVRDPDVAGRALAARDAAEPLLDSADVADVVGVQVLARTGAHDLARGRRGSGVPLAICFFDPRHPTATSDAHWRLGDGFVQVPCCPACGSAAAHDGTPDYLRLSARRGTVPYWERDDVWARTGFGAISDELARDVLADRADGRG